MAAYVIRRFLTLLLNQTGRVAYIPGEINACRRKPMADELSERVFAILKKHAKTRPGEITENTVLEEIGLESIEVVECVFDLEEAFDITNPNPGENADIDTRFATAGEVVIAVRQLVEQALIT
jgi:acyl carrier protein